MLSVEVIISAVFIIGLIIAIDRAGRFLQKTSPKILTYIDYGSFVVAIAAGGLMSIGTGGVVVKYVLLISAVIYFIALRYTSHKDPSAPHQP